jgi:hypothetical protein
VDGAGGGAFLPRVGVLRDDRGVGPNRRGYTILGWLVWQVGSRIVKRKVGQKMAENRVKLALAGAVLLVVGGGLAALAARSAGAPATPSSGYRAVFSLVRAP